MGIDSGMMGDKPRSNFNFRQPRSEKCNLGCTSTITKSREWLCLY